MSIWGQLILFTVLVGAAAWLWTVRAEIPEIYAKITGEPVETNKAQTRRADRRRPVIVERVGSTTTEEVVAAVGTGRARNSVMIQTKTSGVVADFRSKGGPVDKGDLILKLQSKSSELAVEIASQKVTEAERQYERAQSLKERQVYSQAKVDDARTELERARLELGQAKEKLKDLDIRAPFDGVLGIPKVEVGDTVTSATAIVTLDNRVEILVEFEVPEQFLARLAVGQSISAATPSYAGRRFAGRIENIDSRIDATSRTVTVRAVLPNPDDLLRPGMSFAVELSLPGGKHPSVPELALQWRKGESYVWIVRGGEAQKVVVEMVKRRNSLILVDGELKPGDLVVVEGVQRLRPGVEVDYTEPPGGEQPVAEKTPAARKANDT